ncbi:MAG: ScyD/ScyE family protein [Pyrinomonadaceae bacterium]|nr:ScyD/ScyE family protein [Pyrinomonadaceae bacterium]
MKKAASILATLVFLFVGLTGSLPAQTTQVVTAGLNLPTKIIPGPRNTFLVSENGTMDANTGRISVIDRTTGVRHTLISGLPSGVSNLGGPPESDGTTGIDLNGRVLWVTSGVGDAATMIGGSQYPTGSPSSPLFCSVLGVILPRNFESLNSEFEMTLKDQEDIAAGHWVRIRNADGDSIFVFLVADIPDYRPEPQPNAPNAIRTSHPFAVEQVGWNLFVADASYNELHKVNLFTGELSTFVEFPNRPNPLFGTIGGPFIEAVPDNVHFVGRKLLVPELTGFPMINGQSDVQAVNLWTGEHETILSGLASTMDIMPVNQRFGRDGYYVLEFSTNFLANAPGRLRRFDRDGNASVVVPTLITPSSMARDDRTGDIFVTNIFPGTITRVRF